VDPQHCLAEVGPLVPGVAEAGGEQAAQRLGSELAIKNPSKKTQKTHPKKNTKNVFLGVFYLFFIFNFL
jgi:hypothetical protein